MTTHRFRVAMPDVMRQYIQAIQGVGGIIGYGDMHLEMEIEQDDLYSLGVTASELEQELTAITCEIISVERVC